MSEVGLFYSKNKKQVAVPLKHVSYEIKLVGTCSQITITQSFINNTSTAIEALYVFPKDDAAVITHFSFETEGHRFHTKVEEKDQAFKQYSDAIEKGDGAALLDQLTGDLLQISVGNLKPEQKISFCIQLSQIMHASDDTFRFFLPLTRFPRYQRLEADPIQAEMQNEGLAGKVPYTMELNVVWENSLIKTISSKTHPEWEQPHVESGSPMFTRSKLIADTDSFARDLELIAEPVSALANASYVAQHDNGSTILYSHFVPQFDNWAPAKAKEVVFLLDCSGSMGGEPMENAKQALELCLRSLSEGDSFSFVVFGSEYKIISDKENKPFAYTEKSFGTALKQIQKFDADMGGTELFHVVEELLNRSRSQEKAQEWVLLTDGGVSDPEKVVQLVAKAKQKPRVFTFGIGHGASSALLKGLARVSGGACEMILEDSNISETVLRNFARIDQPRVENLRLDCDGVKIDLAEPLLPVFEGDSWNVFARIETSKKVPERVRLIGTVDGGAISLLSPVNNLGKWNVPGCLWAHQHIKHLEDSEDESGSRQSARKISIRKNEILKIALEFGITSSQTSLVGIEERQEGEKWIEKPKLVIIPSLFAADREPEEDGVETSYCLSFAAVREHASLCVESAAFDSPVFMRKQIFSVEKTASAIPSHEWHLELMALVNFKGIFGFDETVPFLKKYFSNIDETITKIRWDLGIATENDLIATLLAVRALQIDTVAVKVGKKIIKKAMTELAAAGVDSKELDKIHLMRA